MKMTTKCHAKKQEKNSANTLINKQKELTLTQRRKEQ